MAAYRGESLQPAKQQRGGVILCVEMMCAYCNDNGETRQQLAVWLLA